MRASSGAEVVVCLTVTIAVATLEISMVWMKLWVLEVLLIMDFRSPRTYFPVGIRLVLVMQAHSRTKARHANKRGLSRVRVILLLQSSFVSRIRRLLM